MSVGPLGAFKDTNKNESSKKIVTPLPVSCFTNVKNVEFLSNMPSALLSYTSVKSACVPIVTNINWEHRCYQKSFGPEIDKRKKFIYYDFENLQDEIFCCEQGYRQHSSCRHVSKRRVDVPTADFVKPSICPSRKIKYLILNYAHESVDTVAIYDALFFLSDPCLMCRVSKKTTG